jgi:diguanylate cyclase (GGDEF)-like protein
LETERLVEKTIHLELTEKLEAERKALDELAGAAKFLEINDIRLPRLKDFLPVQLVEGASINQAPFAARQFDEKFHILQAPGLFLPDLAYFRAKCEDRETPLAIGFIDIDDFKSLNTAHGHAKVDRNVLPRFMQAVEAHFYQHGCAYRQGGDEYLALLPSLSKQLAIYFFDDLRLKLAKLTYPDVPAQTRVSIGVCHVDVDCPLTDQELRERANRAAQFAKEKGKNCVASYRGSWFSNEDLEVVAR